MNYNILIQIICTLAAHNPAFEGVRTPFLDVARTLAAAALLFAASSAGPSFTSVEPWLAAASSFGATSSTAGPLGYSLAFVDDASLEEVLALASLVLVP
jgi:hypothetical protein